MGEMSSMPPHVPQAEPKHRPSRPERHVYAPGHHRYSRFVNVAKIVLPSLAAILLALVAAWPRLTADGEGFTVGFADLSADAVDSLTMINARYFGIDQQNRPFKVTADSATEEGVRNGIVVLSEPKADFTTRSGANVYVEAREGFYHQTSQLLELLGEVSLYHADGYELHTEEAEIDLATSSARGAKAVDGNGPQGRLNGQGFVITEGGQQVVVTGRSSLQMKGPGSK